MPVKSCRSGGRPGYKWGDRGKCYTYPSGDDGARRKAKRKAVIQGIAAGERPAHALTGEQVSALLEEGREQAEAAHLADLTAIYMRHIVQLGELAQKRFALVAAAEWQPPTEGVLVTQAALDALAVSLSRSAGPIWTRIVIQTALAPLARVEIAWDVKHPAAASLIERASERTGLRLGDAMQPVLRKIVANAYEQGLNVRDTAEAIRSGIREASSWQADMLARTDLNSLANGASKAAAKLTEMGYKTWDATLDARTRLEHADAHAQTVPIDAMFTVGGEDADYPGDPNLSSAMACNCRCSLTYGESLDESAALLADGGVMMADVATRRQRRKRGDRRAAKPNETLAAESTVDVALVASPQAIGINGTAGIEGKISDDNSLAPRVLMPESLFWPEMPVSFMAQTVTAEGHDGAEVAGRVDEFKRRRATGRMRNILFAGELTTPYGVNDIGPMIDDKSLRYVSLDLGASQWAIVKRMDLSIVPKEDLDIESLENGEYALGLTSGKVKALTAVPSQAIEGAMVALTAAADDCGVAIDALSTDEVLALVASGTWTPDPERIFRIVVPAALEQGEFVADDEEEIALIASPAPKHPPREWFETPEPQGKHPLTVRKDGRVWGHLATWDSCHVGFLPQCVPPPRSPSNYARFHACELDADDGTPVWVGKLMFSPTDGGHADRRLSAQKAAEYYDRTGMAAAYLRVFDGKHGIWAAGSLNPALNDEQREEMRRELRLNPPSGDWRPVDGHYELICALAVAVPGFPISRATATVTVTASAEGIELEDAIIASSGLFDPDPAAVVALELIGLHDEEREAEERIRLLAARAEGVEALAALVE